MPAQENFNRYEAIGKLQEESALLSQFFTHIVSGGKKHPTLESTIDKLCELSQICNIGDLLSCDKRGDTIVHFYEDFLTHYDPALRKALGVFYTPSPVVRYLVLMVDKILVEDFGISGGRAAFYGDYMRDEHGLLSRIIGFEIMMTSYVVAHLNIRRTIDETIGHPPDTQLPTKIYLTNTLAPPNTSVERSDRVSLFDFSAAITDEAYKADT